MLKNRKKINKEQNIKKKIILLVTPNLNIQGGVTEFNKMLMKYSHVSLKPFVLSSAGKKQNIIQIHFNIILMCYAIFLYYVSHL